MSRATIVRQVEAVTWAGPGASLPEGWHLAGPEVHWSADRKLIYFTYGRLTPRHWLRVEELSAPPEDRQFLGSILGFTLPDGRKYWRELLPFAFWSVKSEASFKRDHRAVHLDPADEQMMRLWRDYASAEDWGTLSPEGVRTLPQWAEFRETAGSLGRGYRPHYVGPGEWLLDDAQGDSRYRVLTDAQLREAGGHA